MCRFGVMFGLHASSKSHEFYLKVNQKLIFIKSVSISEQRFRMINKNTKNFFRSLNWDIHYTDHLKHYYVLYTFLMNIIERCVRFNVWVTNLILTQNIKSCSFYRCQVLEQTQRNTETTEMAGWNGISNQINTNS